MPQTARAHWEGDLKTGKGTIALGSGAFEGPYSFKTRFEGAPGTTPEELLGAAHAGCFTMALSLGLTTAGHPATSLDTNAVVTLAKVGESFAITRIDLTLTGRRARVVGERVPATGRGREEELHHLARDCECADDADATLTLA